MGVVGGIVGLTDLAFFPVKRRAGGGDPDNGLESKQIAYTPTIGQQDYEQSSYTTPRTLRRSQLLCPLVLPLIRAAELFHEHIPAWKVS